VREHLPKTQYHPHVPPGQLPRADGFDAWLETFAADPLPRTVKVGPPHQRLMGIAEVEHRPRGTMGGPASAIPRISSSDADFFVLKASNKKPRKVRSQARAKLSATVFFLVLFLVLACAAGALLFVHAHTH
jgi:hypothetical protein